MPVTAKLSHLNIAPRKVRLVADLILKKTAKDAKVILSFTVKKATSPLLKLLKSAIANAKQNLGLEELNLYVSKIIVNEGPPAKRWMSKARGQTSEIKKRSSHVLLVLDEIQKKEKDRATVKKSGIVAGEKTTPRLTTKSEKPKPRKPEIKIQKQKSEGFRKRIFSRKSFSR